VLGVRDVLERQRVVEPPLGIRANPCDAGLRSKGPGEGSPRLSDRGRRTAVHLGGTDARGRTPTSDGTPRFFGNRSERKPASCEGMRLGGAAVKIARSVCEVVSGKGLAGLGSSKGRDARLHFDLSRVPLEPPNVVPTPPHAAAHHPAQRIIRSTYHPRSSAKLPSRWDGPRFPVAIQVLGPRRVQSPRPVHGEQPPNG
jgi:hypothetical protein